MSSKRHPSSLTGWFAWGLIYCPLFASAETPAEATQATQATQATSKLNTRSVDEKIDTGVKAFRLGEFSRALGYFELALLQLKPGSQHDIVTFNKAACLFQLGRHADALIAFAALADSEAQFAEVATLNAGFSALELDDLEEALKWLRRAEPIKAVHTEKFALLEERVLALAKNTEIRLTRSAELAAAQGDDDEALALLELALTLAQRRGATTAQHLEKRIAQLRAQAATAPKETRNANEPMPLSLLAAFSSGYDSNVGRGGSTTSYLNFIGVGESAPISTLNLSLDYALPKFKGIYPSFGYLYDLYAVLDDDLSRLSDHYHQMNANIFWSLNHDWRCRALMYGSISQAGLENPSTYLTSGAAALRVRYWASDDWMTEFELVAGHHFGLDETNFLSGAQYRFDLAQSWYRPSTLVRGEFRFLVREAGNTTFALEGDDFVDCNGRCAGGEYTVPYGFLQPDFTLSYELFRTAPVRLRIKNLLGLRRFTADSLAKDQNGTAIPGSEKSRLDLFWQGAVELEWQINDHWSKGSRYSIAINQSNMDSSGEDESHGWDYADRGFIQHTGTIEMLFRY